LLDKTIWFFIYANGTGYANKPAVCQSGKQGFYGHRRRCGSVPQFFHIVTVLRARNDRMEFPQFLMGEIYGTFPLAALGNSLQSHDTCLERDRVDFFSSVLDLARSHLHRVMYRPFIFYCRATRRQAGTQSPEKTPETALPICPGSSKSAASTRREITAACAINIHRRRTLCCRGESSASKKVFPNFTGLSED